MQNFSNLPNSFTKSLPQLISPVGVLRRIPSWWNQRLAGDVFMRRTIDVFTHAADSAWAPLVDQLSDEFQGRLSFTASSTPQSPRQIPLAALIRLLQSEERTQLEIEITVAM
ncbi:hypothetical protein [Methylocystis sp. ATCC 49242]|uniref:hypothetical protein n=1 Tax=Methylocystis sp. ATCC 49242 TaxID=622637 RepID=UPI001185588E|nr:hypothetical protein [Methylocystis sp. ATCC 49242]